jgi:hypothetical protein
VAPRADAFERPALRAEHGYALLLRSAGTARGVSALRRRASRDGLIHNMDVLEARAGDLRALVLSHGHADHHGGLETPSSASPSRAGPRASPGRLARAQDHVPYRRLRPYAPSQADLEREGVEVLAERGPTLLLDKTCSSQDRVERQTPFERGFPGRSPDRPPSWEPDPWSGTTKRSGEPERPRLDRIVRVQSRRRCERGASGDASDGNRPAARIRGREHTCRVRSRRRGQPDCRSVRRWQPDVLMPATAPLARPHELAIALPHAFVPTEWAHVGIRRRDTRRYACLRTRIHTLAGGQRPPARQESPGVVAARGRLPLASRRDPGEFRR